MQGPTQVFKAGGARLFTLQYSYANALPFIAQRYIGNPSHVLRPKLLYIYDKRDKNTLWWYISPVRIVSFKPVVRSRCKRRLTAAFKQALKEHGLDETGRRLVGGSERNIPGKAVGLKGTLRLAVDLPILDATYESIVSQARRAVRYLQNLPDQPNRRVKRR